MALLELLPALLSAMGQLQQQKALRSGTKQADDTPKGDEESSESQKRLYINQFYKSVTARLTDIIKEVSCHSFVDLHLIQYKRSMIRQLTCVDMS